MKEDVLLIVDADPKFDRTRLARGDENALRDSREYEREAFHVLKRWLGRGGRDCG